MAKVAEVIQLMGEFAPTSLAEDWDNVGLQVGDQNTEVKNVLLALDLREGLVQEAIAKDCNLIITHHPLIFKGIKTVTESSYTGRLIRDLIKNEIAVFSAHTNLDISSNGLNDFLIKKLPVKNIEVLSSTTSKNYYKLVTFIPESELKTVKNALYEAGAGKYNNYSHSGFFQAGKGNFKPLAESEPYMGIKNKINEVAEVRFETIVASNKLAQVKKALLKNHPYEEPAWDLFELKNLSIIEGLGRIAVLTEEYKFSELLPLIKESFQLPVLKYSGQLEQKIKKIALCSGSGADFIQTAAYQGADLYLTGDVKFHQAQLAEELNLNLVDFGHYDSEKHVADLLVRELSRRATRSSFASVKFYKSELNTNPWSYQV
jgi:dinuclear metal center YbgI/SA1388 family protein